mmetsp:Transcript_5489/g.13852  ORF Transcript_5489/g.13852 Transcript_5489/m.13852 type:complete len:345 (-) Transcript_5489:2771-3805(-)
MGCGASAGVRESADMTRQLRQMKKEYVTKMTVLVLGAGSSGKSTTVKQFQIVTSSFPKEALEMYKRSIFNVAVNQMVDLIKCSRVLNISLNKDNEKLAQELLDCNPLDVTGKEMQAVYHLWRDEGIMRTWENRENLALDESTEYIKNNIERMKGDDYVPTIDDCLRVRRRTVGIVEMNIPLNGYNIRFVDVGGQRTERRKWISQFEVAQCILYVIALDEYDMRLYEDNSVNRLFESVKLFTDILNFEPLAHLPIIIFFNKYDLLEEKIGRSPLAAVLGEYKGGPNAKEAYKYIRNLYMQQIPSARIQNVFDHVTTAVDQDCMKKVWSSLSCMLMERVAKEDTVI